MPDPVAVNSMFARIARRYDVANHLLSLGVDIWWRKKLVQAVKAAEPRAILDLATGSGDVAFALSRKLPEQVQILGMDFCQPMLDEAEIKKASSHYANVTFQQGDAMNLALADNSYDAVTISFGLRNMSDLRKSLVEMRRVLQPGGRAFVLEFSQPARWFRSLYYFYIRRILPRFAHLVTGDREAYVYLNETIEQFPDREALSAEIHAAGFSSVKARSMSFGIVALHEAIK
ncbi:MAG: bifunctional demethylmenaquinone methyltransferase/2-methoxy-6-polyprenyl-1,4-benzoquinol methylase UbiE [Nibricoccus sp.]